MSGKNIFAISGSLRSGSSNHNILRFLGGLMPAEINYSIYEDLAQIPPFDPGLDNEHPPQPVVDFRHKINNANVVIICTPEYAFGVPGQLKNALDWTVSNSTLVDKQVALITASSVGDSAHASLLKTLGALSADVIADLLVPFIRAKIDSDGNIIDKDLKVGLGIIRDTILK
ncbi:NADPH-dependent FMN reductase [Mucilaginibacter sp. L196]|uniref:NADPH-dependent FMN reductase n=1 Tax=Mucilaginibacter sp. L196 TaxID=1641870 RepID=UPI00131CF083|nr:NADPH-dependent FMN reductase [Mucilaginibacter sp. L196]